MPSSKEIGKSALTTELEVLKDVAKGENVNTVAKKRLKKTVEHSWTILFPGWHPEKL